MQYKSKDKAYMQNLKTAVYRLERRDGTEQSKPWEHIRRYIVVNDLIDFIRNDEKNPNRVDYNYNPNMVDVDYLFVTATEHPKELAILDALIKTAGITNYYRTSYSKSKSTKIVELDSLTSSLKSEIKLINAKRTMIFGPHIGKLVLGETTIHEPLESGDKIITSSIIQVLKSEKKVANHIKRLMWNDFQKIIVNG